MMSYGWGEPPGGWWALILKLGIKREHALRITDLCSCQELLMSFLVKYGMKLTSRKLLFRTL